MPQTSEAPEDFISSQDLWSRRSFMKRAVGQVGVLLLSSQFTEELAAIQQTVLDKVRSTDLTALSIGPILFAAKIQLRQAGATPVIAQQS